MNEELKATNALLDIGIALPLRPLRFRKWKRVHRVTMKRPPLGGLLRILRVYFKLHVTPDALNKMSEDDALKFMLKHGKDVSKIVALAVWSGFIGGKIFAPLLAWHLRWRCHPNVLFHAMSEFMNLQDAKSFTIIIRSVSAINVAAPNLSQERKRS